MDATPGAFASIWRRDLVSNADTGAYATPVQALGSYTAFGMKFINSRAVGCLPANGGCFDPLVK